MPHGRTFVYVSIDNPFMQAAQGVANELSTDLNQPTGAVVVLDGKIVGKFANQSALKNKRLLELHKNGWCVRRLLKVPTGQKYWLCLGCASFKHHGETGATRDALLRNPEIDGAELYLYGHWWCCKPCWNEMEKAKIGKVYLLENSHILFNKNHLGN